MLSLDRMVYRILQNVRDPSARRFLKTDVVEAINAGIDVVAANLIDAREDILANLDNGGEPLLLTMPAAGTDGVSRAELPAGFARMLQVEVLSGGTWVTIEEVRQGQIPGRRRSPSSVAAALPEQTYEITGGRYFELSPGFTATLAGRVRIKYECEIPPLLMGKVAASGASNFTMPAAVSEDEGSLPFERIDDIYNGYQIRIFEGTGATKDYTVSDFVGDTGVLTVSSAFVPALDDLDSKFAFITPFRGPVRAADRLIQIRAEIELLGTKRNEDVSTRVSMYNELEEALLVKISKMSNTPGQIVPVDYLEDAYYY